MKWLLEIDRPEELWKQSELAGFDLVVIVQSIIYYIYYYYLVVEYTTVTQAPLS